MYKTYPIIYPERLQGALQWEPNPYIQHPILFPFPPKEQTLITKQINSVKQNFHKKKNLQDVEDQQAWERDL